MAEKKKIEGFFNDSVGRALGLGRNRALNELAKALKGDPNALVTIDDFRCDAEQVEVGIDGNVTKSQPTNILKP